MFKYRVPREYCSCPWSSFGAVHTYMYIHCAFPSFLRGAMRVRVSLECVFVRVSKNECEESVCQLRFVPNARELRTTVIRYCDKSSKPGLFFFLPFIGKRVHREHRREETTKKKQKQSIRWNCVYCTQCMLQLYESIDSDLEETLNL